MQRPSANPQFQLVLLPGLGADHRLFESQRAAFPQLIVPPWIPPQAKESLPSYARRLAKTVQPSPDVPLILGGVSFGGMLAYEMAHYLKPSAVVLIASCTSPRGLRREFRAGRWLLPALPVPLWSVAKLLAWPVVQIRLGVPRSQKTMAIRMFKESDSRFMHWTLQAILNWQPTPLQGIPVFHIHGSCDPLIPARYVNADRIIAGGGHMINVSHADEVNGFIAQVATMSKVISAFVEAARDFCSLLDSLADGKPQDFYQRLHTSLSQLTRSAGELPFGYTENTENSGRMSHEQWRQLMKQISAAIDPEVAALIEEDKDDPESATRAFMLSDCLADIYRDLRDGLYHYDKGEAASLQEALWCWKFSYEHHWGLHLFDALHTVHRIRFQLYAE